MLQQYDSRSGLVIKMSNKSFYFFSDPLLFWNSTSRKYRNQGKLTVAKDRGVQGYILYLPFGAIKKNLIKFYNKICILGLKFVYMYIVTYRKFHAMHSIACFRSINTKDIGFQIEQHDILCLNFDYFLCQISIFLV